jgi:type IV secretory pathway VirB9-like protein
MGSIKAMAMISLSTAALALALSVSCQQEPPPRPIPTSVPVEWVYDHYQSEKEANPTRLEQRVDNGEAVAFRGVITKIEDSKIQFLNEDRFLEHDKYVECKFSSKQNMLRLSKGDTVMVYGKLDGVNSAVKFKGCVLLSS